MGVIENRIKISEIEKGGGSSDVSNIYSEDEIKIGTWIDGKPLYRKVIDARVNGNGWNGRTPIEAPENIETLIKLDGVGNDAENGSGNLWMISTLTDNNCQLYINKTTKLFHCANAQWGYIFYIIMEYTKTID